MGRGDANPVWDNWVKNEFLTAMRAKGKLPALVGEARERKYAEIAATKGKIFSSEEQMMKEASATLGKMNEVMERRRLARKELKNRVKQMEAALLSETRATLALEKELSTLKAQAPAEAQAQTQDAKPE